MSEELRPVRVWDLPTRLFHWVLVLAIVASVVSAKIGGNAMVWHMRLGYLVFTLLAFRLIWGFIGGRWSRFAAFLYSPAALLQYLRRSSPPQAHHDVGHSPLGALSVFALLALLGVQVATGLFADDEIATTGPLVRFVSGATSSLMTSWHKAYGQWLVISLAVLHIVAVLTYRFAQGRDLVGPMIRGDKLLSAGVPAARDGARERVVALVVVLVCAMAVAALVSLGG
jgi:cytochrome b